MSLKKQIFEDALKTIEKRSQENKMTLMNREAEIREKLPTVYALKQELATTSIEIGRAIFGACGDVSRRIEELKNNNLSLQKRIGDELEKNGYPRDYLSAIYTCKSCLDTGFDDGKKCRCLKLEESRLMAERLNMSCALKESRFDNFKLYFYSDSALPGKQSPREIMTKIFDYCIDYVENFGHKSESLLMMGSTGLGKTHLSLAIAGEVIKKGYYVLYATSHDFLRIAEDERFGRISREEGILSEMEEADLLIIDDLGAEVSSEFNVSEINNIISLRINEGKPSIVNTNLTVADMERRYSARLVSRLFSEYTCLRYEGEDVRLLKAQNRRKGRI